MKIEWNGNNCRFVLCLNIIKRREAHNKMRMTSDFFQYKLPNKHTSLGRVLKSLPSKDPVIIASTTHIQGSNNQQENFEKPLTSYY